jgi:hypothetical protein
VTWDNLDRGYMQINNECIWFGSRGLTADGRTKLLQIKRAQRNTTAAAHAANDRLYWIEHDIQLLSNWSAAPPPTPATMAINSTSTNLAHVYIITFAAPLLRRMGAMKLRYTEDNAKSAALSYRELTTSIIADTPPGSVVAGVPCFPFNNVELYVPCGVKAGGANLAFDVTGGTNTVPGADVVLDARIFGEDFDTGVERLMATYKKSDRGIGKSITPDGVLKRVRFNAIYTAITGAYKGAAATDIGLSDGLNERAQRFTLDQACKIDAIAIWARESASGDTRDIVVPLRTPVSGSGSPEPANTVWLGSHAKILNANFATTYGWASVAINSGNPVTVPASSVYDLTALHDSGSGQIYWGYWTAAYAKGNRWDEGPWAERPEHDHGFLILGDGAIVQPEAPTGMGGAVVLDNLTVTFDNTTPRTPSIFRAPQETIYIHRGTLSSDTTGQQLQLFYVAAINELIQIDCARKTVIIDDTLGIYAPAAVTPSDAEQWLHLVAGGNTLRYTEPGIGTQTIQTFWPEQWG